MSQSSNDSFPTVMHIATVLETHAVLLPGLKAIHESLVKKVRHHLNLERRVQKHHQDWKNPHPGCYSSNTRSRVRWLCPSNKSRHWTGGIETQINKLIGSRRNCCWDRTQRLHWFRVEDSWTSNSLNWLQVYYCPKQIRSTCFSWRSS